MKQPKGRSRRPWLLVLCTLIILSFSCKKQTSEEEGIEIIEAPGVAGPSDERIAMPAAFLSGQGTPISSAALARCDNLVSPAQADILFVSGTTLETCTTEIAQALERGALIAITNPDKAETAAWCAANGYTYAGDETNPNDVHLIYAFNAHHDYYFLDDFIDDDPNHNYNTLINSFVTWANTQMESGQGSANQTKATPNDIKELFHAQTITHTAHIGIADGELAHVILSRPDRLTKYSTIDVSYTIYPLYSFEANPTSGDFYVVEGTFTVHNAGMYNGQWVNKHGGVRSHLCGFYLSAFDINATFCNAQMQEFTGVSFPAGATPVPETTVGATTYTSGFSWGLNGSITGGVTAGNPTATMTIGGNVGWNNSTSRQISDLNIEKKAPNGQVNHTVTVNNLPSKGHYDVPSIAKSDLTINQTWVWHVPSTRDNSTETFAMQVRMTPTYKGYHWYSSKADFSTRTFTAGSTENDLTFAAKLTAPNRIPTGKLTVVNSSTTHHYLEDIQIWKAESAADAAPDYTITQTIASSTGGAATEGSSASLWLPVGSYRMELTRYNLNEQGERINQQTVKTLNNLTVTLAGTTVADGGSGSFVVK